MSRPRTAREKIVSRAAAARTIRRLKSRGERVVFTSGCFDLVHRGHVRSLEQAKSLGTFLVVGINTDATVRRLKGAGRPLVPARARAEVVAALASVDLVVLFSEPTPRRLLGALRPDVYAKGGDWPLRVLREKDLPPDFEGRVVRLRQVPRARSSLLVERVRRNPKAASGRQKRRSR